MEAEKKKSSELTFYVIVALALLALGGAAWFYFGREERKQPVEAVSSEPDLSFLERLEGNYSMKIKSGEDVSYTTAAVRKVSEDHYSITRITVYGPMYYTFTLSDDGKVASEELGAGFASYQSGLDKTTIRFEKEYFVCELTR